LLHPIRVPTSTNIKIHRDIAHLHHPPLSAVV